MPRKRWYSLLLECSSALYVQAWYSNVLFIVQKWALRTSCSANQLMGFFRALFDDSPSHYEQLIPISLMTLSRRIALLQDRLHMGGLFSPRFRAPQRPERSKVGTTGWRTMKNQNFICSYDQSSSILC